MISYRDILISFMVGEGRFPAPNPHFVLGKNKRTIYACKGGNVYSLVTKSNDEYIINYDTPNKSQLKITRELCHGLEVSAKALKNVSIRFKDVFSHIMFYDRNKGMVVMNKQGDFFLSGTDEGRPFLIQLMRSPKSLEHAFSMLKPKSVVVAENQGLKVLRQGDWYFVPTFLDDEALSYKLNIKKLKIMDAGLPVAEEDHFNKHYATLAATRKGVFARGVVRHINPATHRATLKHKPLYLGSDWYKVCHNKLPSW